MKALIKKSTACGTVSAPPSKSMAHRLLIGAGLSQGASTVSGVYPSEDVKATLNCLDALGVTHSGKSGTISVSGAAKLLPNAVLNCNECGSTLRFFIPIALLSGVETVLTGSKRLMQRPLDVYADICAEKGLYYSQTETEVRVKGPLKSGSYSLRGDVSSQFVSGLLFALPLTEGNSTITLTGKVESKPYIDMTLEALAAYGIDAGWQSENTLYVKGNQSYKATSLTVEGDYSNAAFLHALNYVGGEVTVTGLNPGSLQGDKVYAQYFEALKNGTPTLDISDCPDLGPVLFALAAARNGAVFTGTARLKIKESDRGAAMAAELAKLGATVTVEDNTITVSGGITPPTLPLNGHNDHRIVMALSVLLTTCGGQIDGAEAVNKSMPNFFDYLRSLSVECDLYD